MGAFTSLPTWSVPATDGMGALTSSRVLLLWGEGCGLVVVILERSWRPAHGPAVLRRGLEPKITGRLPGLRHPHQRRPVRAPRRLDLGLAGARNQPDPLAGDQAAGHQR